MDVALSILTIDYNNVEKNLKPLDEYVDYIHMDVMDGVFVPNISFGYSFIDSIKKSITKTVDTHLMIEYPDKYIEKFAKSSDYITFHFEAKSDINKTIDLIHNCGCKAGLSIKPNTKVSEILEYLPNLEMVLVMSVEPGFGGQSFMPNSIEKVKMLKELREKNGYHYLINIDGGINDKTAPFISEYVDLAVSGSYICNSATPIENVKKLKAL